MKPIIAVALFFLILPVHARTIVKTNVIVHQRAEAQPKCPIEIRPGRSIGPLHLGDTKAALERSGLTVVTAPSGDPDFNVGRFAITLDGDRKTKMIEVQIGELPDCLMFKDKKISRSSSPQALAKIF